MSDLNLEQTSHAYPAYRTWLLLIAAGLSLAVVALVAPGLGIAALLLLLSALLILPSLPTKLIIAVFIALLALPISVEGPLGAELSPQNIGLLILLFLAIDQLWRRPRQVPKIRLGGLVAGYAFVSLVSVAAGSALSGGVADVWILYRLVLIGPLAYFAFSILFSNLSRIEISLKALAIAASLIGLYGILQTVTQGDILPGVTLPSRDPRSSMFRAYGTFQHPNAFGVFLSITIFLTWSIFATAQSRRARLFWLAAVGLQAGGIAATFSRSAWVATLAGLAVLVLFSLRETLISRRNLRRGVALLALGILAFLILYYRAPILAERLQSISDPGSIGEFRWRLMIWEYAVGEIMQHPLLGTGTTTISADAVGFNPEELASFSSHNLLISMAYSRGLLVTAIYALITLLYLLVGALLENKTRLLSFDKSLVTALLAAMVAFQVSGIGTASMNWANLSILYWFLVALMFSIYDNELRIRRSKSYDPTASFTLAPADPMPSNAQPAGHS